MERKSNSGLTERVVTKLCSRPVLPATGSSQPVSFLEHLIKSAFVMSESTRVPSIFSTLVTRISPVAATL